MGNNETTGQQPTSGRVPIRYTDPTQEKGALQNVAANVVTVLTPGEEILYIALQNKTAMTLKKDCCVATSNRLLLYRPGLLGRVVFDDLHWQDVEKFTSSNAFCRAR
ncbi:MAG: PH domain-containing protein [Chloroflexi bacterium]|nr:PH domain-containing protein [Chloroflexota bacterium]